MESARSFQSHEKTGRTKRSVQFAPSVKTRATSKGAGVSTERTKANPLEDDSIQESIQIAESISQSLRSQSVTEVSKSRSAQKLHAAV